MYAYNFTVSMCEQWNFPCGFFFLIVIKIIINCMCIIKKCKRMKNKYKSQSDSKKIEEIS